jgi:hypothetical protein
MALYGFTLLFSYLYLVIASGITGLNLFIESGKAIEELLSSVIMIILNKIYYSKRAHLFKN